MPDEDPWFSYGDPFVKWPGDDEGLDVAALTELANYGTGGVPSGKSTTTTVATGGGTKPPATATGSKLVPKDGARTPMNPDDAIRVLASTFRFVARVRPFFGQVVFAAAQCGLETGQFQSMYGWNFGNLSWGIPWLPESQTPTYWQSTIDKGWKGALFADPAVAGVAYWKLMRSKTWRHVLAIAGRERYEDAAIAAVRAGYAAPSALASYQSAIPQLAAAYAPRVSKMVPGLPRVMGSPVIAGVAGGAAVAGALGGAWLLRKR